MADSIVASSVRASRRLVPRLGAVVLGIAPVIAVAFPATAGAGVQRLSPAITAKYRCSSNVGGSATASATVVGKTPKSVSKPRTAVRMTGFQSIVSIPGSVFDKAYQAGVRSFSGKITKFDITATDATKAVVNVAKTPFKFGPIKLLPKNNPPATIKLPKNPATIGPWTAKAKGTMSFRTGTTVLVLTAPGLGSITAVCAPAPAALLSTTKVA